MSFRLNKDRATQAAGVLLRYASNGQMTRLRLLKLLYIADRESLRDKGRPITGDRIVAMDHGPVLSGIYDMIKNTHADPGSWAVHIRSRGIDVILESNPGVGSLSRYEVQKLQEVSRRYEDLDDWALVKDVVAGFPEYQNNKAPDGSMRPIPVRDVLVAVGRQDDLCEILQEAAEDEALDGFWERVTQT